LIPSRGTSVASFRSTLCIGAVCKSHGSQRTFWSQLSQKSSAHF
jgi:hypothetical protein